MYLQVVLVQCIAVEIFSVVENMRKNFNVIFTLTYAS